jgi:hypothetical protein
MEPTGSFYMALSLTLLQLYNVAQLSVNFFYSKCFSTGLKVQNVSLSLGGGTKHISAERDKDAAITTCFRMLLNV